jgi:hypothetical protein
MNTENAVWICWREFRDSQSMPSRRLEDRIRELCAKVIVAREEEVAPAIADLKEALHEHNMRLRKLAATKLTRLESSQSGPLH